MLEKCGPLQLGAVGASGCEGGGWRRLSAGTTGSLGLEVKRLSTDTSQRRRTCIIQAALDKATLQPRRSALATQVPPLPSAAGYRKEKQLAFVSATRYKN